MSLLATVERAHRRKLARTADDEIADLVAALSMDPYGYVMAAWDWGSGQLENYPDGPDAWQIDWLKDFGREIRKRDFNGKDPVLPVMTATATGHGVGKSALNGWLANFIPSTRPRSKGIVTANTGPQLETKTWPEIVKWAHLSITGHWFKFTSGRGAMKMRHRDDPENWRLDAVAWQEHRSEAFAGLHAATSSPYYLFDEASAIPDKILETAEGGLTDGEPFLILWGNPTKNSGYFHRCFGARRHRFMLKRVDSREAKMTNKQLIDGWIEDYGLDSDFVRVRVLGQFPKTSATQFIPTDDVDRAMHPETLYEPQPTDPIIIGVDVARHGNAQSVVTIRQGRDCRSQPPRKYRGLATDQLASIVNELAHQLLPDAICVDGGGVGGGVVDMLLRLKTPNIFEVNFGWKSPDRKYRNMGTFMWGEMRDALKAGLSLPKDEELKQELVAREYFFDQNNAYMLESKDDLEKRGEASPDNADSLALTFAVRPGPRDPLATMAQLAGRGRGSSWDYSPFEDRG